MDLKTREIAAEEVLCGLLIGSASSVDIGEIPLTKGKVAKIDDPRYWYIWPGRLFVRPYVYLRTKFWLWSGREWWAMCAWCFQPFGTETCAPENRDKRHECSPILRFILWGPQMDWSNDVLLALFLTISMVLAVIGTSCAEHQKSKPSPIPAVRNWKCNPLTFDVKTSDATAWLCHDERTGAIIDAKVRP